MPIYSAGPFSHVFFAFDRQHALRTFTYRKHRESPTSSLVTNVVAIVDGGPTFNEVLIDTSYL